MRSFLHAKGRDRLKERDRLINEHMHLVRAVAANLCKKLPSFIEFDDLISAGNEGLVAAASTFNPAVGVKFSLFARARIHGAMIDHLRSTDPIKRTARTWQKRIRHIEARLDRPVIDEDVAREFDCTAAQAREIRALASVKLFSLDTKQRTDQKGAYDVPCPWPSAFDVLASGELAAVVKKALARLPPRHRSVLEMYYHHDFSIRQIGQRIGVSDGRVCQIRTSALKKLEAVLHEFAVESLDRREAPGAHSLAQAIQPSPLCSLRSEPQAACIRPPRA